MTNAASNARPSIDGFRILRVNTDKTRKHSGSESVYDVYFELSGRPQIEWRVLFGAECNSKNLADKTDLTGMFLILRCPLQEVESKYLPVLKNAVAATNEAYRQFVQNETTAGELREETRKEERKEVDAMAASLRFD